MKIRIVGAELYHADRHVDGRADRKADRQSEYIMFC